MPGDEPSIQAALERVRSLNHRYSAGGPDRFFLFHRSRKYNSEAGCWMGWERKRGKLHEFNRLLRGASDTSYTVQSGSVEGLSHIRYVLTLDTDTVLPRDTAGQLIGTLAHPLNQAHLSADGRRVVEGYGLLQPRVSFLYRTGFRSWFAAIFAGSAGIDPYATAVSDTYMDLFGRGSYTGKGLYEIDPFEATAGRAFPDNHILSHDLIESNYARCGLVTDLEVFDEFPSRYHAYARREHRWARGDWQLLPWLGRKVPLPGAGRAPNVLPLLERWKVVDNLRRSLVPPALLLLLALGWTVLPGSALVWTLLALLVLLMPLVLQLGDALYLSIRHGKARALFDEVRTSVPATAGQVALSIVFLANQAWLLLDAIGRTLYRLFVSRRHLLEWETAAATESRLGNSPRDFARFMMPAMILALVLGVVVGVVAPANLPEAMPLLVLWLVSPLVAYWVSKPRLIRTEQLDDSERQALRLVARKTWRFFEEFVGPEDHYLPPDNFQEDPKGVVAHRTSPTNIGLYLLSSLAAHDLGYLSLPEFLERIKHTLQTLTQLQRYRGHFLNWYETTTLHPLPPGYVSTVDSGNLLACLLTLKQGLREQLQQPIPAPNVLAGMNDTLSLFEMEWQKVSADKKTDADAERVKVLLEGLHGGLVVSPADLAEWLQTLRNLASQADALVSCLRDIPSLPVVPVQCAERLQAQAQGRLQELQSLAPWLERAPAGGNGKAMSGELLRLKSLQEWARVPFPGPGGNGSATVWEEEITHLAEQAEGFAEAMDFRFLYNDERDLFSIGYNLVASRLDPSHYDLLASEACLTSFLAVARGVVPRKHWFHLGRLAVRAAGQLGLASWGGTMFEYLMPRLFLPLAPGTLLDQAHRTAVARQIEYGRELGLPWGISESGFYLLDAGGDYQYQAFGVPGLGLKRGLAKDHVIAPYATMLAVVIAPREALANLERLRTEGAEGPFGFYEAIDYTPSRVAADSAPRHKQGGRHGNKDSRVSLNHAPHHPASSKGKVVRQYMAHHQGMGLLAVADCLMSSAGAMMPWARRLHQEPAVRAVELLLDERIPVAPPLLQLYEQEESAPRRGYVVPYPVSRRITNPMTPAPRTHLLSNGHYTVMVTNAGSGFSTCRGLDITRWRTDRTQDPWGQFLYLRDLDQGNVWSSAFQPTSAVRPDFFEAVFSIDKADFHRIDFEIESLLEITVAPDKCVEVRRLMLHNLSSQPRQIEVTSYAEVVLLPHGTDVAHPAFGKLFLETEWLQHSEDHPASAPSAGRPASGYPALLCRRRPRSAEQKPIWAVHVLAADHRADGPTSYETDRERFLGRRRTPADAEALSRDLTETTGPVLDPIFCLRRVVRLGPGEKAMLAFSTGVADSREEALALADQFHTLGAVTRAFELAWAHSRVELYHLHLRIEEAHLYQRLAGHLLYPGSSLRGSVEALSANRQGQPGLWRQGISGDYPLLLLYLTGSGGVPLFRQLLHAHNYWRAKKFLVDLVVILEESSGYYDELYETALNLARSGDARDRIDSPGGVFLRKGSHLTEPDRQLLVAAARVVLDDRNGNLGPQIDVMEPVRTLPPRLKSRKGLLPPSMTPGTVEQPRKLRFENGVGGFSPDGYEYLIAPADPAQSPPTPWINVVANPAAGFLITDSGAGYTWAGNSQTNRLTPWSNDPVSDPPGEAVYLRDEETGAVWSPTPLPIRDGQPIVVRHGQGYTIFERTLQGIDHELTVFMTLEDPVKIWLLRLRNQTGTERRLSAAFYAEWVLGTTREETALHIITEKDADTGALFARNAFNIDFGLAVAFADVNIRARSLTGDRTEFLGRNGTLAAPAALGRTGLSGRTGPALDPCAAIHASLVLRPGEEEVVVFLLGQADDAASARRLVMRYRQPRDANAALERVVTHWDGWLGTIQVQTPDPALDLMLNRWLLYQVLSCRFWGRSAFYQSGGAYGFRDQLQDAMALVYALPQEARAHLLRAASRQFIEGDVQHWWHPPSGNGVRTRFSDDFLWLPFVVCHYVQTTQDRDVLREQIPYLDGPPLRNGQEEVYFHPTVSHQTGTLYDHCVRALDHGWKLGEHGLPLMGTGDWNDGMNKVGAGGKGESVWVAWFQIACLNGLAPLAEQQGDSARAKLCRERAEQLRQAVEANAYDGKWYRRAYFDDGTPLGSASNEECQIDSLPQTWAYLSEAGNPERSALALEEVLRRLVVWKERLILLFTPPFDSGPLQPGYIKGYLPGIRENGGQYTHAATWVVQALARKGDGNTAHAAFDLLNPVRQGDTPQAMVRYRGEPYVVAGDVYSRPPHVGRCGWTWYTGSAAWLYRVALEDLLGFRVHGDRLIISPCVPSSWAEFFISYHRGGTTYRIHVENPDQVQQGVAQVTVDGEPVHGGEVSLVDDRKEHQVHIVLGATPQSKPDTD
jgi:cyclic beta-1,2-glucan synthetase